MFEPKRIKYFFELLINGIVILLSIGMTVLALWALWVTH